MTTDAGMFPASDVPRVTRYPVAGGCPDGTYDGPRWPWLIGQACGCELQRDLGHTCDPGFGSEA